MKVKFIIISILLVCLVGCGSSLPDEETMEALLESAVDDYDKDKEILEEKIKVCKQYELNVLKEIAKGGISSVESNLVQSIVANDVTGEEQQINTELPEPLGIYARVNLLSILDTDISTCTRVLENKVIDLTESMNTTEEVEVSNEVENEEDTEVELEDDTETSEDTAEVSEEDTEEEISVNISTEDDTEITESSTETIEVNGEATETTMEITQDTEEEITEGDISTENNIETESKEIDSTEEIVPEDIESTEITDENTEISTEVSDSEYNDVIDEETNNTEDSTEVLSQEDKEAIEDIVELFNKKELKTESNIDLTVFDGTINFTVDEMISLVILSELDIIYTYNQETDIVKQNFIFSYENLSFVYIISWKEEKIVGVQDAKIINVIDNDDVIDSLPKGEVTE